jgi:hypothetical protein
MPSKRDYVCLCALYYVGLCALCIADFNTLAGGIPDAFSSASSLQTLTLRHCFLRGALPASLALLPRLQALDASGNGLDGELPDDLGKPPLRYLFLNKNKFTGARPPGPVAAFASAEGLAMHGRTMGLSCLSVCFSQKEPDAVQAP